MMKSIKLFLIAFLFAFVSSCVNPMPREQKSQEFTGYIVEKEYVPSHRRDASPEKQIINARFSMAPIIAHRMNENRKEQEEYNAEIVPSEWTLFIANRYETIAFKVDSITFVMRKCGEHVTVIKK